MALLSVRYTRKPGSGGLEFESLSRICFSVVLVSFAAVLWDVTGGASLRDIPKMAAKGTTVVPT